MSGFYKFLALVLSLSFSNALITQTQSDFYDPYDYSMKNLKDNDISGEYYKEYSLPPHFEKPPLVTPKVPYRPVVPSIPGITPNLTNPNSKNAQNMIINPYNASINYEALSRSQKQKELRQEEHKKRTDLLKKQKYTETVSRRFSIIFFLTIPFAALFGYGIALSTGTAKTLEGSILIGTTAIGLSTWNAWYDMKYVENKNTEKQEYSTLLPDKHNWNIRFTLAEKKF